MEIGVHFSGELSSGLWTNCCNVAVQDEKKCPKCKATLVEGNYQWRARNAQTYISSGDDYE